MQKIREEMMARMAKEKETASAPTTTTKTPTENVVSENTSITEASVTVPIISQVSAGDGTQIPLLTAQTNDSSSGETTLQSSTATLKKRIKVEKTDSGYNRIEQKSTAKEMPPECAMDNNVNAQKSLLTNEKCKELVNEEIEEQVNEETFKQQSETLLSNEHSEHQENNELQEDDSEEQNGDSEVEEENSDVQNKDSNIQKGHSIDIQDENAEMQKEKSHMHEESIVEQKQEQNTDMQEANTVSRENQEDDGEGNNEDDGEHEDDDVIADEQNVTHKICDQPNKSPECKASEVSQDKNEISNQQKEEEEDNYYEDDELMDNETDSEPKNDNICQQLNDNDENLNKDINNHSDTSKFHSQSNTHEQNIIKAPQNTDITYPKSQQSENLYNTNYNIVQPQHSDANFINNDKEASGTLLSHVNNDDEELKSMIDDLTNDMVTQLNSIATTSGNDNLYETNCNTIVDNTSTLEKSANQFSYSNINQNVSPANNVSENFLNSNNTTVPNSGLSEIELLTSANVPTLADELKLLEDISDESLGDMSSHGDNDDGQNIDWELEKRLLDDELN